ncbi:hypothetical protein HDV05_003634 [Chytridiales sp. JEL 0842]|nr:hypothetical protein HDV05_003634 [Chytridiales sp. JEL 0842]
MSQKELEESYKKLHSYPFNLLHPTTIRAAERAHEIAYEELQKLRLVETGLVKVGGMVYPLASGGKG